MDHSTMPNMDHSTMSDMPMPAKPAASAAPVGDMPGMDHSSMPGMSPGAMQGMDHSATPPKGQGDMTGKIGQAACREREGQYVYISVAAINLNKKTRTIKETK